MCKFRNNSHRISFFASILTPTIFPRLFQNTQKSTHCIVNQKQVSENLKSTNYPTDCQQFQNLKKAQQVDFYQHFLRKPHIFINS